MEIKIITMFGNLEWCNAKYNIKYSYEKLGRKGISINSNIKGKEHWSSKETLQYDLNGKLIKKWTNKIEASKTLGIDAGSISKCCNGIRKTAGGFVWKYE